jgi:hypothetical protein
MQEGEREQMDQLSQIILTSPTQWARVLVKTSAISASSNFSMNQYQWTAYCIMFHTAINHKNKKTIKKTSFVSAYYMRFMNVSHS